MTHYVENVGTDDVVCIEVLQADHFSGTLRLVPLHILRSNESRYLPWAMDRPYATANRDGYPELDQQHRLPIQKGEAVYRPWTVVAQLDFLSLCVFFYISGSCR